MRRSLVVIIMVLTVAGMATAQDFSKIELFGGYSLLLFSSKDVTRMQNKVASHYGPEMNAYYNKVFKEGGTASAAYNINDKYGVEVNASYNVGKILWADGKQRGEITSSKLKVSDLSFFAGPRYRHKLSDKVTAFVHVMAGLNRFMIKPSMLVGGVETFELGIPFNHANNFAIKAGGGLDVKIKESLSIRAFQGDFIWSEANLTTVPKTELSLKNVSLSAGVVWYLFKK
jgi:hypothetical protein